MNILWIMTDQHRADCLGCMGNDVIQTPHLDRLAGQGVVFDNAFCQSPVCMASRASLFTGRYPEAAGVRGMGILPPVQTTLPEWLSRQGYATGAFGKVHFTPEKYTRQELGSDTPILDWRRFADDAHLAPIADDPYKENYGFQAHVGCDDACQGPFRDWLRERAPHLADARRPPGVPGCSGDTFVSPFPSEFHQSTFIAERATAFVEHQAGSEQPWFALCSFVAPHHPFEAPADQIARYRHADIPLPQAKGGVSMTDVPPRLAMAIGEMDQYTPEAQRTMVQHYYASISLIDDCVGRLLDTLDATGQAEHTVVVFVSDHGEMLGNHGLLRKPSFHYDELLRVPLLVRGPGIRPSRVPGLVELVDLHPTMHGLAGLPINAGVQGEDWSGSLQRGEPVGKTDIYSDMFDMDPMVFEQGQGAFAGCRTLRTDAWKLNVYPDHGPGCAQLFNLRHDPDETTDLYHDPAHRDRREVLFWRLVQRMHAQADPLPLRLRQW